MKSIARLLKKTTVILSFAVSLLLYIGCTKEGPAGPAGTQGPAGVAGVQGGKGDKGDKGDSGNANVKVYSKDISSSIWETVGNNAAGYLKLTIPAPQVLTSDVVNNWINLVYVYTSDFKGSWALLPYYSERNIRVTADITVGAIILKRDQDGTPYTQSWFNKVRLICIEPSSTGTIARKSEPLVDYTDYAAVCRYYSIPE